MKWIVKGAHQKMRCLFSIKINTPSYGWVKRNITMMEELSIDTTLEGLSHE